MLLVRSINILIVIDICRNLSPRSYSLQLFVSLLWFCLGRRRLFIVLPSVRDVDILSQEGAHVEKEICKVLTYTEPP